ncbi:MAG: Xaa-Pro aminopeptidase [Candidatus Contendobacter sp.]|nr:Xaa-Pro aminopeptidase [Candidatus Contendobacter sp.]MDG4556530.1 Xaa-Pro aminopeptidase [Candidatus Contendobacter sp.]
MLARAIPAAVFARRRRALMERMGPGSIALLPAAPSTPRNRDVHHPFRQDSDFYYLTGFPEPEAIAVLVPGGEHEFLLFCRDRDPHMEIWHGRRAGPQGARERYGANNAHPIAEIDRLLPPLLENRERVFYAIGCNPDFDRRVMDWINQVRGKARTGVRAPVTFVALEHLLHAMRLRKEPEEIAVMRESARIAAEAHRRAMRACRPGIMEYELEAEILHTFIRNGAGWAYPSIVGGGDNSCILHYTENNAPLRDGDIVLIDAGAEVDGYASDITRSFPVNGRFSGEQRVIYELVLAAQKAAIAKVLPGCHFNEPHDAAVRTLTEGLAALGLLQGDVEELIAAERHKSFYMHRTGHWLGMDVHDVGDYKTGDDWRLFEPGMVTTIEPGLYIPAGGKILDAHWARLGVDLEIELDERWQRIGVRIEDDVLVTTEGHEVLTAAAPKEIADIEALMREGR